ncbi:TIGR03086 family metal-binding protein [Nocardioides sp. LS1]|uniref:TIGR03086 family metal-binding protein n=1 Tax=Nocardioides sp. LS1 TaxID=1027620 RepID=UPI000F6214B8|nr:TIGR03086 family metal-binding protein [Nocardioides sp. LS1]GCD90316.1 hypothetical protein NLS1_23220 [Nocardioides sp. LS1]
MTPRLEAAVELLGRSLVYTRGALEGVGPDLLDRPTPCSAWTLDQLLRHMEDALDAFTEAAGGAVSVRRPASPVPRVSTLQDKACALLGAWSHAARATGSDVVVGDVGVASEVLVSTAALEITVHGWDVAQATGRRTPIPADLAADLLPVAHRVVDPTDRGLRFDRARAAADDAGADVHLLEFLGRHLSGPARQNRDGTSPHPDAAS